MTETKWLSEDEREAWLALVSIMFRLPGRVENQLRTEEDMSLAEYLVLAMLSEAPQRQHKMSAPATATNTSQSRLARIVARGEREIVFDRLSTEQVAQLREIGRALNCGDNARSVLGLD